MITQAMAGRQEKRAAGGQASSIGSAAPAYDARNRRIKGFSLAPHRSMDSIRGLFARIQGVERRNPSSSRTTVRAFVSGELVEGLLADPSLPYTDRSLPYEVEAAVPCGNAVEGCSMVYFGRNSRKRMPASEERVFTEELLGVMRIAGCVQPVRREDAMRRVADAGFAISVLGAPTETDVRQLLELYREAYQRYTFDINEHTIGQMLDGDNIVLVARDGQGIASSLIAERCRLRLEDGKGLWVVELSDYATLRRARRNGLTTAMQIEIVDILRSMENGTPSVIYAEDRAAWSAVNRSSAKAGLRYCGTLPKHCVLASDRDFEERGEYETLNVWAVPRGE